MAVLYVQLLFLLKPSFPMIGCVSLAPKWHMPVPRLRLLCAGKFQCRLTPSHDRGWAIKQRRWNSTLFVVRTIKRGNRPHCFHVLVEIGQARHTPVVRLSGEPVEWEVPIKSTHSFTTTWSKLIDCPASYGLQMAYTQQRQKRHPTLKRQWKWHVR